MRVRRETAVRALGGACGGAIPSFDGVLALERLDQGKGCFETLRVRLGDGAQTTTYAATYELARTKVRIERLARPEPLEAWCLGHAVRDAITGGFFVRATGSPLGELRKAGVALASVPFAAPWDRERACVHVAGGVVRIARRGELAPQPPGDLLQAGPLLVREGVSCVQSDREGLSAARHQFDTDITLGRYPRAALALTASDRLLALVCD